MDLLSLVMDQPLIMVSLGVSLLPILLVALIFLAGMLRGMFRALAEMRAQAARGEEYDELLEGVDADDLDEVNGVPGRRGAAAKAGPAAVGGPAGPAATPAGESGEESETEEETQPVSAGSPMQDLLNSVFGDDDRHAYPEALVGDLEPVEIAELAQFAEHIAGQLGARRRSRV